MVSTTFATVVQSSFYCFSDSPKVISSRTTTVKQSNALYLNGQTSYSLGWSNRVSRLLVRKTHSRRFRSVCFFKNGGEKSKGSIQEDVSQFPAYKKLLPFYRAFEKGKIKIKNCWDVELIAMIM